MKIKTKFRTRRNVIQMAPYIGIKYIHWCFFFLFKCKCRYMLENVLVGKCKCAVTWKGIHSSTHGTLFFFWSYSCCSKRVLKGLETHTFTQIQLHINLCGFLFILRHLFAVSLGLLFS